jgi:RNA polymerase sigma-70 factor (ECF subfamily)
MNPPAESFSCVAAAWRAHEAELRGYLTHRLGHADLAEDVLQDVFVKAMRQGRSFCEVANRRAWLFQVARNALVDELRASRPTEPLPEDLPDAVAEPPSPVDALADCMERVMEQLPAADAQILRACDLGGQTQRAFAQAQGLSLPAAKSRLLRARERLRAQLTQTCGVRFSEEGRVCCHVGRDAPPQPRSPARAIT